MSSQARTAGTARSDRVQGVARLSAAAHIWLNERWAGDTAGPAGQGIEQADAVDGSVIVRALGDLDLYSSPELQSVLAGLFRTRRPTILDLSAISFIDCRGLGVVLRAAGTGQAEDWSFIVAAVRAPCVIRLIALVEVGSALPAYAAADRSPDHSRSVL